MQEFKQGRYTATDVQWGMALDLSGMDNRSLIAYGFHGRKNQQWEFRPCGSGFTIGSVARSSSFLEVRNWTGQREFIVTETAPMFWDVELMYNGNKSWNHPEDGAEDDEEEKDVYVRIKPLHSDMALSFKSGHAGAPLFLTKERDMSTYWRLSPVAAAARQQVVKNPPISTTESAQRGAATTTESTQRGAATTTESVQRGAAATPMITTTSVTTTTRAVTRIGVVAGFVAGDA